MIALLLLIILGLLWALAALAWSFLSYPYSPTMKEGSHQD